MSFWKRFPAYRQIVPVFALTVMLIYGWTMYRMLNKLPSWLLYLRPYEIISNFSYALVFNFLECVLVTGLIVLAGALLPFHREKDEYFIAFGSALGLLGLGYLIYLTWQVGASKANLFPWGVFAWSPFILAAILLAAFFIPRIKTIKVLLEAFADRTVIFLYLFLPFSALGLVILLVNNLF